MAEYDIAPVIPITKRCSRCKKRKPTSEFYKSSSNKSGLQDNCILCCKEKSRDWYQSNKSKLDKVARRQLLSQWREKNRDRCLAYNRKWAKDNPDKVKASNKRRYERTKHIIRAKSRDNNRKKKYGLSPEQYNNMFEAQNKACAICKSHEPYSKFGWHVDHCHISGAVRGILCNRCNTSMGMAGDSIDRLRAMIDYLSRAAIRDDVEIDT